MRRYSEADKADVSEEADEPAAQAEHDPGL
ncbi:hypothetical protein IFHNHDMJ_02901 [Synechococcus sp. CBW1107]|nr:hypothetical protein IFHNHDMJ_02901 [Synechococcus sp. CBW1107]